MLKFVYIREILKERKEAKTFEKNLKNQKADLKLQSLINSFKKLQKENEYQPNRAQLIKEIRLFSRINKRQIAPVPYFAPKLLSLTAFITLFIAGVVIYTYFYQTSPQITRVDKTSIKNEVNSIALDKYIVKQQSNDAMAAEINTAFNNIEYSSEKRR